MYILRVRLERSWVFSSSCDGFLIFFFFALKVFQISHLKTLHHSWPSNAPSQVSIVMLCHLKCIIHYFLLESSTVECFSLCDIKVATPTPTALAELISICQYDWLISKPHHVWRLRPRGHVCVLPSDQNYQAGHFLFCFFLSGTFVFLFPPTWMATISYISQLLCLFVGWKDNGAVFLNAQVVSLSFSFLTFPSSSSPLHPFPHLTSHLYSPHFTVSLSSPPPPRFISLPLFFPFIWLSPLTSSPFLSHYSLLHWFADRLRDWAQKHPIHHPTLHPP